MPSSTDKSIRVGIRGSELSQAQFREVQALLPHLDLEAMVISTVGDRDRTTSLRALDKTDFFTRDIDEAQLEGRCRLAVHSAKDLPDPLPKGLVLAALTEGVDPSDALVFREGDTLEALPSGARIATSSFRRELAVRSLRHDLSFVDIRGNVDERLQELREGRIDGCVVAEAALIRLELTDLNRIQLPGETAPLQGQLALMAREDDWEMRLLLAPLDTRSLHRVLYTGLDPTSFLARCECALFYYPTIRSAAVEVELGNLSGYTHVIVTSKTAVSVLGERLEKLREATFVAVGEVTAGRLQGKVLVAKEETAEGVVALLETLNLDGARVLWPRSALSRPMISNYLQRRGVAFDAPVIYETHYHRPFAPPSLDCIDELVFTSPSSVDGFLQLYRTLPTEKRVTAQGPVTAEYIRTRTSL